MTYKITPMTAWNEEGWRNVVEETDPSIHCYAVWFVTKTLHSEDNQWVADFKNRDDAIGFVRFKEGQA